MKARIRVKQAGLPATASGRERALVDFYDQLDREGLTATELAREAGVGRAYLTRVLNGHESGARTWTKVLPLLSQAALFHVKQCFAWNTHAQRALEWVETIRALKARITTYETEFGTVHVLERSRPFR
jgi:hypothetical protein